MQKIKSRIKLIKQKPNSGIINWNADGLPTQTQLLGGWTSYSGGFLNWALILILFTSIFSCKNVKTASSCEFDFFEKTSGIKFPKNVEIIDCEDDLEGLIWLHLKFEEKDANEFIKDFKMHQYSDLQGDEKDVFYNQMGSKDQQTIDHIQMFMGDSINQITKDKFTYLKSLSKKPKGLTYVLNKESGLFWGQIQYPDWGGL